MNEKNEDPYACAKQLDKFRVIESGNDMNTDIIISRIIKNRLVYCSRFRTQPIFL